jgi:hypothetical protein
MEQMMERLLGKIDACLEKMAAHQERMEVNMNAWQKGNKAYLQEMGTRSDSRSQKKLAVTQRWMTHRVCPACRKGCGHNRPMVKNR